MLKDARSGCRGIQLLSRLARTRSLVVNLFFPSRLFLFFFFASFPISTLRFCVAVEEQVQYKKKQLLDSKTFIDTLFLLLFFLHQDMDVSSNLFHVSKFQRNPSNIAILTRCL